MSQSVNVAEKCLVCGESALEDLVDFGQVPIMCGVFYDDEQEARSAATGRLELAMCPSCTHVQNVAFDESLVDYDGDYDNSLHYSPTFQRFADELVARLSATYDLSGKEVVEIGSGKGDFLISLVEHSGAKGTGYDPTYVGKNAEHPGVEFRTEYFPIGDQPPHFDLLAARHVLEHLTDPVTFLSGIKDAIAGTDSVVYLEVPAAEFDFGPEGLWDFIYPHVSYFSTESILKLAELAGLRVLDVRRDYEGQFLSVELAAPKEGAGQDSADPALELDKESYRADLAKFADRWNSAAGRYRALISEAVDSGREAVMWGVGSKGVTFLTTVDPEKRLLGGVDLNDNKWGLMVPLSLHEVLSPESLRGKDVATVFITNPIYRDEVADKLKELGLDADVHVAL